MAMLTPLQKVRLAAAAQSKRLRREKKGPQMVMGKRRQLMNKMRRRDPYKRKKAQAQLSSWA